MIYKIYGKHLTEALINGGKFIIFSYDGTFALVRSDEEIVGALDVYNESHLAELYNDSLYKQPCKDC